MSEDPERYRLSPEEHERIFRQQIVPALTGGLSPNDRPQAIILGGQPGAGKSALQGSAEQELRARGGVLSIVGDDLRGYHPYYEDLLERADKTAAFFTDRDSGLWVEKLIAYAKETRFHIVIEGTMRLPDKVAQTMTDLRTAKYRVEARVLAVNSRWSKLGIQQRYERLLADQGSARFTLDAAHDAAYSGMPLTLERIEREPLADRVAAYARGDVLLYENEQTDGQWSRAPQARQVVEAERLRPFTAAEKAQYALAWQEVWTLKISRAASSGELRQVRGPREEALVSAFGDAESRELLRTALDARTFRSEERTAEVARDALRGRGRGR